MERVIALPGGITAEATEDGYVAIKALVGSVVLSLDCTKPNALKLAAKIIDAADDLDRRDDG